MLVENPVFYMFNCASAQYKTILLAEVSEKLNVIKCLQLKIKINIFFDFTNKF